MATKIASVKNIALETLRARGVRALYCSISPGSCLLPCPPAPEEPLPKGVTRRKFFRGLLDGQYSLTDLSASDVSAGTFELRSLSLKQLLYLRAFRTAGIHTSMASANPGGVHECHAGFVRQLDLRLAEQICQAAFQTSLPAPHERLPVASEIQMVAGLVEYLQERGTVFEPLRPDSPPSASPPSQPQCPHALTPSHCWRLSIRIPANPRTPQLRVGRKGHHNRAASLSPPPPPAFFPSSDTKAATMDGPPISPPSGTYFLRLPDLQICASRPKGAIFGYLDFDRHSIRRPVSGRRSFVNWQVWRAEDGDELKDDSDRWEDCVTELKKTVELFGTQKELTGGLQALLDTGKTNAEAQPQKGAWVGLQAEPSLSSSEDELPPPREEIRKTDFVAARVAALQNQIN